jgi:hypothetical protein
MSGRYSPLNAHDSQVVPEADGAFVGVDMHTLDRSGTQPGSLLGRVVYLGRAPP